MGRWAYHIPVLGYHKVGDILPDHVPTVTPEAFAGQLAFLKKHRYRVLDVDAIIDIALAGGRMPHRATAITFDDGYVETYTIAWPLLKQYGFPSIVFVTPNEVATRGFADWDQLRTMAADSMRVGSHTMNHSYLPDVPAEQLPLEITQSKQVIESELGRPVDYLSYPIGGYTAEAQSVAKEAGYKAAFTTNRAFPGVHEDPFALRRVKITERDTNPWALSAKLSGYYDAFRRLKHPY